MGDLTLALNRQRSPFASEGITETKIDTAAHGHLNGLGGAEDEIHKAEIVRPQRTAEQQIGPKAQSAAHHRTAQEMQKTDSQARLCIG